MQNLTGNRLRSLLRHLDKNFHAIVLFMEKYVSSGNFERVILFRKYSK